jgi:hypothetical protein
VSSKFLLYPGVSDQTKLTFMRTRHLIALCTAISAVTLILLPAAAAPVTERMKQDCRADYQRYCKAYAVGSEALRACMSRSSKKLSNMCLAALVDGGEMTKAEAAKLQKAKHPKPSTHKRSHKKH